MTAPITTRQAADLLHVSTRTIQRMVADGRLTTITQLSGVRGAMLFDEATIRAIAEEAAA